MIHHEVIQGSTEWLKAKLGVASASNFAKIITPKTMKLSSQADDYANRIIAERLLGVPLEDFPKSYWMERGSMLEQEAGEMYAFEVEKPLSLAGFITTDDEMFGASPDYFVGDDGLVEIKAPAPWTHIENVLAERIDPTYIPQVQGQLWVTKRKWVDWYSYNPDIPPSRIRTEADPTFQAALEQCLFEFRRLLEGKIHKLDAKGYWKPKPRPKPAKGFAKPGPDISTILDAG